MKKSLLSVMTVATVAAGCFTASTASGDMIFSTVGTVDSYNTGGWASISYLPANSPKYDSVIAVAFTPDNNYSLSSIEVGLGWNDGVKLADVWLMSDNNDRPGTTIESFQTSNLPLYDYLGSSSPSMPLVRLDSVHLPMLQAGTQYWVGASSANAAPGVAFWVGTDESSFPYKMASINYLATSPSWQVSSFDHGAPPALRVNGDLVLVPLPGAVWLLGAGLVTSAGLLRRHRQ